VQYNKLDAQMGYVYAVELDLRLKFPSLVHHHRANVVHIINFWTQVVENNFLPLVHVHHAVST
jgi:hypothetical protein